MNRTNWERIGEWIAPDAFTLIELLVVISVIALLLAISVGKTDSGVSLEAFEA